MKRLQIVGLLLAVAVATSAAAQSADWQVLEGIPVGTKIKLILKHRRTFGHCQLEAVTNDGLSCYFSALGLRQYARDEIAEVRLGHHSARTGFFIGAAAGAILGVAGGSGENNGRVVGLIVLMPVLGGVGAGLGAIVDPFVHGKTIYRSPDLNRAATPKP
jgi:hypothetical protein